MDFNHEKGILGKVRGEFISAACKSFPEAKEGEVFERKAEIDVEHVGRVRITYKLTKFKHHKSVHFSWHAVHAECVPADA